MKKGKVYFKHLYTPLFNPIKKNKIRAEEKAHI